MASQNGAYLCVLLLCKDNRLFLSIFRKVYFLCHILGIIRNHYIHTVCSNIDNLVSHSNNRIKDGME